MASEEATERLGKPAQALDSRPGVEKHIVCAVVNISEELS
jgi:hypothetical protein